MKNNANLPLLIGALIIIFLIMISHFVSDTYKAHLYEEASLDGFTIKDVLISYIYRCPYCKNIGEEFMSKMKRYKTHQAHFIRFQCENCKKWIVVSPDKNDY